MSERYVIVHRSYDPIVIEHLGEILRDAGIAARVLGTRSAALIGVGSSITELHIGVPEDQAGEATEFLEDYFETDGAELLAREGLLDGYDDDENEDDDELADQPPLRPLLAGVAVVLTFGVGHLYARRRITGLVLAAGQIGIFAVLFSSHRWPEAVGWYSGFGVVVLYDLLGSQVAVRATNRGRRRGALAQAFSGLAAVGLAVAAATFISERAQDWRPRSLLPAATDYGDGAPYRSVEDLQRRHDYDPWLDPYTPPAPSAP